MLSLSNSLPDEARPDSLKGQALVKKEEPAEKDDKQEPEQKPEPKEEKKSEEEAAAGLGALFG